MFDTNNSMLFLGMQSYVHNLSDVEEGGETTFPFENGSNTDIGYDYEKRIGLKIKTNRGDGLLFFSMFLNQTIDPASVKLRIRIVLFRD